LFGKGIHQWTRSTSSLKFVGISQVPIPPPFLARKYLATPAVPDREITTIRSENNDPGRASGGSPAVRHPEQSGAGKPANAASRFFGHDSIVLEFRFPAAGLARLAFGVL
jgi:hypothetical protein